MADRARGRGEAGAPPWRFIVLLGLPGAGKSTVGPLVAARLGGAFVDLDAEIAAEAGMSVGEIFAREGEAGFRARETRATASLVARARDAASASGLPGAAPVVVAPGGGWVEGPANRALLGRHMWSVYLRVQVATAVSRMGASASSRPLIAGAGTAERLLELFRRREPLYVQSNHTLDVDSMTPAEVCDSIVALASRSAPD
ncbi:MAG: shikimate kinase [Gemmatimonadetes bacterium]|nr:shikimate kinase [Gemmatimonadota bacterium]